MPSVPLFTFQDAVDHLLDAAGANNDSRALTLAKNAVIAAYRIVNGAHKWTSLIRMMRLTTNEPYTTGTVEYDHTGGANSRQLTLTTGTWPSWAARGFVVIDNRRYDVAERISDSIVTLNLNSNPGEDVASGTSYSLLRDTYTLPSDFLAMSQLVDPNNPPALDYTEPEQINYAAISQETQGIPRDYTIIADPDYVGMMAVRMFPPPSDVRVYEAVMTRKPLPLSIYNYDTGEITAVASTTAVTGTDTVWTSTMQGAVIRFGDDDNQPTGISGLYPFVEERLLKTITNGTSVVVDTALVNNYSGVKYTISSLIDLDEAVMLPLFLCACEREFARMQRDYEAYGIIQQAFIEKLIDAKCADRRFTTDANGSYHPSKLADVAQIED